MSRDYRVRSYNQYREYFRLGKLESIAQLGCSDEVTARLTSVYGESVDSLDFLVGLYAEKSSSNSVFGELMTAMVTHDAFTQALTNPLLSRNVLSVATVTSVGLDTLKQTESLNDLWQRNKDSAPTSKSGSFDLTMDFVNK